MGLDAKSENDVAEDHAEHAHRTMLSGSLSEHRIHLGVSPNVLDWLKVEARMYGLTVPALIRHKLQTMFENRPQDWRDKLKG